MTKKDPATGHRKRLREKFLKSGLSGFHDYEIIEMLLTLGAPRKDCKQPAKEVLKKFKTLRGALSASPPRATADRRHRSSQRLRYQTGAGSGQRISQTENCRQAGI